MHFENTINFTNWAYRNFTESRTRNDCILTYGFILKEYYNFIDEHIMRECDKNFLYNQIIATYNLRLSTLAV